MGTRAARGGAIRLSQLTRPPTGLKSRKFGISPVQLRELPEGVRGTAFGRALPRSLARRNPRPRRTGDRTRGGAQDVTPTPSRYTVGGVFTYTHVGSHRTLYCLHKRR